MAKILVIDDDPAILVTVDLVLRRAGHDVIATINPYGGLQRFGRAAFDLVIVDLFMPEIDGLQAITRMRLRHPQLAILVLSGHHFEQTAAHRPDFLVNEPHTLCQPAQAIPSRRPARCDRQVPRFVEWQGRELKTCSSRTAAQTTDLTPASTTTAPLSTQTKPANLGRASRARSGKVRIQENHAQLGIRSAMVIRSKSRRASVASTDNWSAQRARRAVLTAAQ